MDEQIPNSGLELAMEFGEQWLQPIQRRLGRACPNLSQSELDAYENVCRKAMNYSHAQVVACWRNADGNEERALELFRLAVLKCFPWISEKSLRHLFSQGCYYAWKNGDLA